MLKRLTGRKTRGQIATSYRSSVSDRELCSEISGLIDERPRALFGSTSAPQLAYEKLSDLAGRSTRILPTFIVMVVVPTLVAFLYLILIATPQFESEQSFTVQQGTKSQRALSGMMALAAQVSGFSTSNQETYMVLEYLRSVSVIEDIGGAPFLEKIFSREDVDAASRMAKGLPIEEVQKYWLEKIIPELDTRSGIINLKVRTFSPDDSLKLATRLTELSEDLVNKVSLRSREKTLQHVEADLQRSADLLATTRNALLAFRVERGSIDPTEDAKNIGSLLSDLTMQKITVDTEIGALRGQVTSDSPMLKVKQEQSQALEKQIAVAENRLTGMAAADNSVAEKLVIYEKLKTDIAYYEQLYSISLSTYERAREDAIKQQIFVIPIVVPQKAESSNYPDCFEVTMSIFLICIGLWAIAAMIIAAIKDHTI